MNLYLPLQHSKPLHRFGLISVCILGYKRVFSVQRPSLCKRCVVRDTIKPTNSTTANVAEVFCITLNLWMEYKPVCRAEWTDIDSRNNLQICWLTRKPVYDVLASPRVRSRSIQKTWDPYFPRKMEGCIWRFLRSLDPHVDSFELHWTDSDRAAYQLGSWVWSHNPQ